MPNKIKFSPGDLVLVSHPEFDIDGNKYLGAIGLCLKTRIKKAGKGRSVATLLIGEEKVGFFMNELEKYVSAK